LKLIYNNLTARQEGLPAGGSRTVYSYDSRREKNIHIYGGKVVENVVQAIARCIVGEQMIRISKKYRVVLTVHDAVMVLVRDYEAKEARDYVEQCMRWVPEWATGLPVNCESGVGKSYGEC
jgi:DNA polymerase